MSKKESASGTTGDGKTQTGKAARMSKLQLLLVTILGGVFIVNSLVSMSHSFGPDSEAGHNFAVHEAIADFKKGMSPKAAKSDTAAQGTSKIASLSCEAFGGPPQQDAEEMVYWSDIPSDAKYISPLKKKRGERRQYMTFEPGTSVDIEWICRLIFLSSIV